MRRVQKTVFISYRRTDEAWALAIYNKLKQHGFDVFIDYLGIGSGSFEREILENIAARAHFLVLLTRHALDRVDEPNDWMRREIECAIDLSRNIVPVMLGEFSFDAPEVRPRLTGQLALLKGYNGLPVPAGYFDSAMERLERQYLSVELDTVLHPPSADAQQSASRQQAAADRLELASSGPIEDQVPVGVQLTQSQRYKDVSMLIERFFQPISSKLKKDTVIWEGIKRDRKNRDA